jgi:hypothetical protein
MRQVASLYVARTKRRLLIGCLSILVGGPVMCACLSLLPTVVFPTLDTIVENGYGNLTIPIILAVGLLVMAAMTGIQFAGLTIITLRRARQLDSTFNHLGLAGSMYQLIGRRYQGVYEGRDVHIYIYRGPTVEFRLKAGADTNFRVTEKSSLPSGFAEVFDASPLGFDDPALGGYAIFSRDENWALNLLRGARVKQAVQNLMSVGAAWAIFRSVEILPGEVVLNLKQSHRWTGNSIDLDAAETWLVELNALAQAAESLPNPAVSAQPTSGSLHEDRKKLDKVLIYAVSAIVFIMPVCFIAAGVLAVILTGQR